MWKRYGLQAAVLCGLVARSAHAQFYEVIVQAEGLGATALLGTDLAIDGGMAVIGCNGVNDFEGSVRVYLWNEGSSSWDFDRSVSPLLVEVGDGFGESCALHEETIVAGAPGGEAGGVGLAGYATIFDPSLFLPRMIYASDAQANSRFGSAVAVSNDWVIIGAPDQEFLPALDAKGVVYVYQRNASSPYWGPTEDFRIRPLGGQAGERLGSSVALSSSHAILGVPLGGANAGGTGRAYVHVRNGSTWSEEDTLVPGEEAGGFGTSVAISGNLAVVGAPLDASDSASWTNTGSAFVFQDSGGEWALVAKLVAPEEENNLLFGIDVAVSGMRIVVGTLDERAYVFSWADLGSGAEWFHSGEVEASDGQPDDDFGRKVALDGDLFAVGARLADPTAATANGGKAYFYSYPVEFALYCFANEGDCPCNNDDADAGCENSTGAGALLSASGSSSVAAHDLKLHAHDLPLDKTVLAFAGTNAVRNPFADGLRCAGGTTVRLGVRNSGATGQVTFQPSATIDPLEPTLSDEFFYQAWYRDGTTPCGSGSNTTNAVRVEFVF